MTADIDLFLTLANNGSGKGNCVLLAKFATLLHGDSACSTEARVPKRTFGSYLLNNDLLTQMSGNSTPRMPRSAYTTKPSKYVASSQSDLMPH